MNLRWIARKALTSTYLYHTSGRRKNLVMQYAYLVLWYRFLLRWLTPYLERFLVTLQ